jgi:transcriptional regulator with XRE-family HTH domain
MTFYQRLEPLMLEKKLSQRDISSIAGVKPPSVNEWKAKGTLPRADTAIKIADYFKVSVKWLVTGQNDPAFTREERSLLELFRQLDDRDRADIIGNAQMKLENAKKGDISSSSGNV